MTWGATAVAATTVVGSYLSNQSSKSAASTSADAQRYAADQAAEAAKFNPVGITTNFGTSNFGYDDQGKLTSAGYTLSPELQALQNQTKGTLGSSYANAQNIANQYSPLTSGAQSAFNLGQKYLATSPEQAASDWYNQQQGLLSGGREQQLAGLRNRVFQTGRSGLATGGTSTGIAATNPEMAAYYNSVAQSNKELAAQADQYGMQRAQFGANLFGTGGSLLNQYNAGQVSAYSPLSSLLGLSSSIEALGQQPLGLSSELAGRQSTAGANAGQFLYSGGANAARTLQAANQYSLPGATLTAFGTSPKASAWFDSLISGNPYGGTPQGGYGQQNQYLTSAYSNPQTEQQRMLAAQMEGFQ